MTVEEQPRRRPGRPATGETPKRNIRVGKIWDECEAATAEGETMTAFVITAITRELAIRQRQKRAAQVLALRAGVDPARMSGAGS